MKKLIIAAAITTIAVVSQGAALSWKWTSTCYNEPNGETAFSGKVYLVNQLSLSQQAALDAFNAGTLNLDTISASSQTTTNGKGTSNTVADPYTGFTPVTDKSGVDYAETYYAALTTVGGKNYLLLTDTLETEISTTQDTQISSSLSAVSKKMQEGKTFTAGGWYTAAAVPEPTSGLLLLLGVAGLALRRRRA